MATPSVLAFDAESRAINFNVWVDDLQLFLQCDRADGLSLFDLTSGASPAPAADAHATVHSQWATRDAAARLAVHCHLPTSELTLLPDSLRVVRDHFLSVCPTTLTVNLLEKSLQAAEKSIVAVGASRGDPRTPIFEGCSPSPLLPSVASAAAADLLGLESGRAGAVEVEVEAAGGVGVAVGVVVGVEVSVAAVEAEAAAAVAVGAEVAEVAAVEEAAKAAVVAAAAEAAEVAVELVAGLRRGRCFGRLTDAWRHQFPKATEIPRWGELSRVGVAIYDLDFDAILSNMYAVSISDEGGCYRCFPPNPGIETAALGTGEAAALGASACASSGTGESALSGTTSASASLTFTFDSGASRSFFRDRTTLTPLSRPVAVSLAHPSGGPVLTHFSTVLPCPAAPSGTLSGLYLPSFSTNLVSGADLQDGGVHQFTPARQRLTHCKEASTGRHLATFTRQPGSSLYTLTTASPPGVESGRVVASGQAFAAASRSGPESAPCSCRLLSHETLLWHHRLGHPSLLRLRGMASRLLVSGLPRSLPPLPQGPSPTCVPCVKGRQRAAPHSSQFPPTEAPLQTLHMDVWGPARVHGQGHERYFLLVVDDYSRYTTVFPLRSKDDLTEVGDASAFRVRGSRAFVRDLSADKLSPRAAPCIFLGFPPNAPGWKFYHPTSRRVLSSQDVTFDESVPYYRLFPYRTLSLPPPPLFLVPGPPPVDPLPPQGPAPSGVSQVDAVEPSLGVLRVGVLSLGVLSLGVLRLCMLSLGVLSLGVLRLGVLSLGVLSQGVLSLRCAELGGAELGGAPLGGSPGASSLREPLSPQELREWFAQCWRRAAGAGGSSATEGAAVAGPGGAPTGSTGAVGPAGTTGVGAAEGVGAETFAGGPAAGTFGGFGAAGGAAGAGAPTGSSGAVPARREPASRPASPVRAARASGHGSRQRPPPVPGTHRMSLRPSTVPLRAPLPSPPQSSLPAFADSESDSLCAASPTVTRLLATVVTDPSFESSAASALVAELVDFAARCRLDYAASLVAEQEEFQCLAAASSHLVSVLLTPEGDPDALGIPTPRSYAEAIEGPYSSQWQAAMDAEMASWKSTGTYVDAVPPFGANIVSGMWIFRVKRPPGSPPVFKARYVARRFSQRQGVDYFQTFSPTPKMTTLRVLLHVAAHCDYELHSLDFSTPFLQGSLH
ncbi:unnamed protein product [Closterium sp. NIES-65]|nr:unnamed protein product [Closterium sp. NIES-65]